MRRWIKHTLMPTDIRRRRILFGPAAGLTMRIDPVTDLRFWAGIHKAELARHFRRLVTPGACGFDIGGAEGYQALMMARLSGQPVVVFEPGAEWRNIVAENMERNGFQAIFEQVFVGATPDDEVATIDAMAEKHFTPDFIKMDIESAEADALAGAAVVLASRKPHMIIEVHGTEVERTCPEILAGHGYRPQIVNPRWWLKEHRPLENNRWLICEGRAPTS